MIFRSPPLTRQRLRMQQAAPVQHLQNDGNEQSQNIENRPINTANTGVAENSLNDGEILAHTMNSDQILHAVLNIEPANRQSGHGEDAENLANQQNLTQQLGEEEEKMDIAEAEIKWTMTCEGGGHVLCKKLLAGDLDPVLSKSQGIGAMVVQIPLQGLITLFILRSNVSMSASKDLLKAILTSDPDFELLKYVEERGDAVRSGSCPGIEEVEIIWKNWVSSCASAHEALKRTGFGQICLEAPISLSELPEADRIGWEKVFNAGKWALEKVRATVVFGKTTLVHQPRVIIGDSSAAQLCGEANNQISAHFIGAVQGTLGDVIRALDKSVLTSKVTSALIKGQTVAQIMEECERIKAICGQFGHVRFVWIPPPYVREKHAQYNELLHGLEHIAAEWFIALTENGQSLIEMWRFGDTFDMTRVRADGKILPEGLKCLRAWIFTQISVFPDDNFLGIRRSSRSLPSVPDQFSELSIHRPHQFSRDHRVHPYSLQSSSSRNTQSRSDGKAYSSRSRRH